MHKHAKLVLQEVISALQAELQPLEAHRVKLDATERDAHDQRCRVEGAALAFQGLITKLQDRQKE